MSQVEVRDDQCQQQRQPKRQKLARQRKQEKQSAPNRCEHFLEKKNRRCAMQKSKGLRFCSEHRVFANNESEVSSEKVSEKRVPCPLDPNHSVKQKELETHLKKCNARPSDTPEPWFKKDFNAKLNIGTVNIAEDAKSQEILETSEVSNEAPLETESAVFKRIFQALEEYDMRTPAPKTKIYIHAGLDTWLSKKENKKHIVQQASLVGAMKDAGLLTSQSFYVEFGCGKAELSRTVNACVVYDKNAETHEEIPNKSDSRNTSSTYGYGLIDRGVNRMKMDNRIVNDCEGSDLRPQIKRSRIDIQHLDLDTFLEPVQHKSMVAISKHLCGVATDLTLKSILNSEKSKSLLDGVVVAMCCRHVCDYGQLLPQSRSHLAQNGVHGPGDFSVLKKIVTWAVCGRREGKEDTHSSGYTYEERERLGLIARRLIDDSRVAAVNILMEGHKAELFLYAEKDTTLENHCLRVTRR